MEWLALTGVSMGQPGKERLSGISFTLRKGEKLAIAGETGSGKSTLLKLIGGMLDAATGKIHFAGKLVTGPLYNLIPGHPGIGFLSQHFELRNNYRVEEILSFHFPVTNPLVTRLIRVCQIGGLLQRKTQELSGGERQRVALAAVLLTQPQLLLLDEPFSNLDAAHRSQIRAVLADVESQLGVSIILVSHDYRDLLSWAGRILVLERGKIVQDDTPGRVYRQPINEYTAALFGAYNLLGREDASGWGLSPSPPGTRYCIRPVDIEWSDGGGGLPATVSRVEFLGSHYRIHAASGSSRYQVTSSHPPPPEGAAVWLSLRKGTAIHYLAGDGILL